MEKLKDVLEKNARYACDCIEEHFLGVEVYRPQSTFILYIFSYGDLAILRGIRMVYRHKELSRERFERYRRQFSPYCSVASLYFWAVAGGAIPALQDPAVKRGR